MTREPIDVTKFATTQARRLLDRLASQSNRTRKSTGVNEVHDLRVAIRRFGQILQVCKPCFVAKDIKRVDRGLKRVMNVAGEVRDLDIAISLLGRSRTPDAALLRRKFQRRRRQIAQVLAHRLQRWTQHRTCSKWRQQLKAHEKVAPQFVTIEDIGSQAVPRLAKRFVALARHGAGQNQQLDQLHQLRIVAKKIRYTLEPFAQLLEPALQGRIEQLKRMQDFLGELNDIEIVYSMVLQEDLSPRLCAALVKRRDRKIAEFSSFWQTEFPADQGLTHWKKDLTRFLAKRSAPPKPPARSEAAMRRDVSHG